MQKTVKAEAWNSFALNQLKCRARGRQSGIPPFVGIGARGVLVETGDAWLAWCRLQTGEDDGRIQSS